MPSQFVTRPDGTIEHVRTGGKAMDPASIKKPDQWTGATKESMQRDKEASTRIVLGAVRNLAQNVLGNAPADALSGLDPETMKAFPEPVRNALKGITGPGPRPVGAPDAKLLGVFPPLPKVKLKDPTEELISGFVQGGMGFFLASRGLRGAGGMAMGVPAVAGVARAARPLTQAAKAVGSFAKGAPGVTGVAARTAIGAGSIVAQGAAPGFIVDYAGFDAGSTLTDQVLKWVEKQSGTPIHAPLLDLVRSAPGDTAADARWKSGVEGMFFVGPAASATIEGLGRVAKSIINLAKARQAASAARGADPNIPPEPPASGQTVDVTAAPVGPNAKVATAPNAGPGVTQAAPKSKASAPDIAKAYMDMRPRTPLWEKQGVETQGRLDDPRADVQAATKDFVEATTIADTAVARASNTVPDEAGPVPTVDRGNAMPSYSQVRETAVADIGTEPTLLQFKAAGQGKGKAGVSGSLKDAKSYDPLFGKIVSVWRDPETGRLLVVNGHNRLDLARRSGVKSILTWEIDAPNARQARAIGAMENIAEGQGTAWDAAKIMRDMGIDGEEMARRNIDVTKGVAQKGVALSRLPQEIFDQGVTGKLSLEKAVALGSVKLDDVVVRDVAAAAAKGNWSADKILQAMQEAKFAQTAEATGGGVLPGFESMFRTSNFEQLLDIRTEAFKALREEMVALTSVAREGRRGILEAAGNVVDVAGSQAARGQAAIAVEIFDRVTGYTGPVRDLLNEMAGQVSAKRSAKAIVAENLERLRAAIEAEGGKPRLPLEQPPAQAVAPSVPSAGTPPPADVKLDPNANPERTARQFGSLNNGKGKWGVTEQQWLDAFNRLGGVPDWFDLVGGKANWEKLMQGQEMPELESRIKALVQGAPPAAPRTAVQPMGNVAAAAIEPPAAAIAPSVEAPGMARAKAAGIPSDAVTASSAPGVMKSVARTLEAMGIASSKADAAARAENAGVILDRSRILGSLSSGIDDLQAAKIRMEDGNYAPNGRYKSVDDLLTKLVDAYKATYPPAAAIEPPAAAAFTDPLSAENLADARLTLGLPGTANLEAITKAAREQGYDGIEWTGTAGTPGGKGGRIDLRSDMESRSELPLGEQPLAGMPAKWLVPEDVANETKALVTDVVRRVVGDDIALRFYDSIVIKKGTKAHGTADRNVEIGGSYNPYANSGFGGRGEVFMDPIAEAISFTRMRLKVTATKEHFKDLLNYRADKLETAFHEAFHAVQQRYLTLKEINVMNSGIAKARLWFADSNAARRGRIIERAKELGKKPEFQMPSETQAQGFEVYGPAMEAGVSPAAALLGFPIEDLKALYSVKGLTGSRWADGILKSVVAATNVINKLIDTVEKIGNAAQFRGWTSIEDIYRKAYTGELRLKGKAFGMQPAFGPLERYEPGVEPSLALKTTEQLDTMAAEQLMRGIALLEQRGEFDLAKEWRDALAADQASNTEVGRINGEQASEVPPPREPVEPGPGPENSDEWVRRFAQQLGMTKEQLLSGEVTYEDLLTNSFQKTQSPSGQTIYTATKEDLVDGYNAMSKVLPDRAEMSGYPVFTREELRALNQDWFTRRGEDGEAIMRGLDPLIAGFDEYQLGALNRAMWLADKKQVEASMEAAMWLNSANVEGLNQSERLARLITAAESARATHEAIMKVTRPWGQLGVEMQVPRNYKVPPATGVAEEAINAHPPAETIDIEEAIKNELEAEGARPIEETITGKIDDELVEAANGGEITPKAQAAADALAQALVSAGAEPAMRNRWWRRFDDPALQNMGPNGLLMLRVNNLISSGVTATTNLGNGLLNLARFPLQQAGGALAQGEMKRAMYSMMMFQQYWMNISNAMRVAGHSLKAGRSLMNMDVSSLDWLDRVAQREAQGELLSGPDAPTGWTINTVNMSQDMAQRPIGQTINKLWQIVGTGASRLAIGIDTFNSTLAGYAYEHVRHLPRGMDLATERGMKEFSSEAWKFAQQYADARTQETMKSAVIDGKNLADVVMESPQAKNFMNAINFTDDIWANLETRTLAEGVSIGQSRGLAGNELQDFAQKYVDEGQLQHRLANFALNSRGLAFGRIGSLPGEAMQAFSNMRVVGPIFKFVQPFQRVPSNIIKSAMRNTPAAVFVDTWWRDITSEDAFTRDRAIGEVALGSAVLSMVAMGSALGYMRFNGGGPIDFAAKEKWTTIEKRMPYSIQVWDEAAGAWSKPTSMRALEPFATLFGAIGDYTDIANSLSTENRNRLGGSLVLSLARLSTSGMLSKSYFQGFNELYEAFFNPSKIITGPSQRNSVARYMSRIVASMVPYSSALRAARRETDPVSRTVDPSDVGGLMGFFQETLDEVRNAVPGWSNTLPARRDWINGAPILTQGILGAEIIPAEMPWLQAAMQFTPFAAFQQGRETLGPVHEEMGMLTGKGTNFSGPRASDFGPEMRLTPGELEDYTMRFAAVKDENGLTFEQSATRMIESKQYQSWPVEGPSSRDVSLRAAAIQTEIQRYKKLAKDDFKFSTAKGQLIAAEEAAAEARKAEKTYIQRYGMDNSLQPAQPSAPWSPTPR